MTKPPGAPRDEGPVSEPTLMRFVDGDLPPREHAFVAGLIAAHPEATHSVRAYRFTREELPSAFAAALQVPPGLISRCLPESGSRMQAPRPGFKLMIPRWRVPTMAIAASVAIVLAGAAGWLLREAMHPPDVSQLVGIAPAALQHALNETLTGEVTRLGKVSIKPMSTFPSLEGRWCRQYAVIDGGRARATGLACRTPEGAWHIDVLAASKSVQPHRSDNAFAAGVQLDPVASYRDQIIGGNVLTKESEQHLIRNEGWMRAP